MSRTYDKQHATTVVLTADVEAQRLVSFGGGYPSGAAGAGGLTDAQGVAEYAGKTGEAISVVTGYSALVVAGGAIDAGAFVKPGTDGKVVAGTIADHCGRAVEAAGGDGAVIEVIVLPHVHPAA